MTTSEVIPAGFCGSCGQSHRQIFTDTGQHADHDFVMHGASVTKPTEEEYLSTMRQDPNAKCSTCSNTWAWHVSVDPAPRHAFNDGTMAASETFGKKLGDGTRAKPGAPVSEVQEAPWPFDPVLRQALINKGVITADDLTEAEKMIRAVTQQYNGGKP